MRITWHDIGEKIYETGVSQGVLYLMGTDSYENGVAWNGLTSVTESPDGAEATDLYADNIKYASMRSAETFGGNIEAYHYPDEFEECDGTAELAPGVTIGQQARKSFGLCYRTEIGNDKSSTAGYKLHLVYGATASPSEKAYETINDSPDAITFSWKFDTTPVNVTGHKATSSIVIDSTKCNADKLKTIEDKLYGTATEEATLPLPDEIIEMLA